MGKVYSLGRVAAILSILGATFAAGMKLGTFFPV